VILGTAGHIDHGKTTLVRALTGVDTDRLPEEKRRGITIELGFAPLVLDGVGAIGVVDVPGHEAFVRTMVAGATGIDLALVVVAADEGVMPQTREHLTILELLGVRRGVIALTKTDLADADWLALVEDDVRASCQRAFPDAPIIATSATRGTGIDHLKMALTDLARGVPSRDADDVFRLPVDRTFTVKGTGTVVTGTVWSGGLTRDGSVRILPGERVARVRGIQAHGVTIDRASPGNRCAIALAGVDIDDVPRGSVLVSDPEWHATTVARAELSFVGEAGRSVRQRSWLRFHVGTSEVGARVVSSELPAAPGVPVAARLVFDEAIVVRAGDRFVLRTSAPLNTIGGGVIVDPYAPRRARPWPAGLTAGDRLGRIVDESGFSGAELQSLPIRLGVPPAELTSIVEGVAGTLVVQGERVIARVALETLEGRILEALAAHQTLSPLDDGVPIQLLRSRLPAPAELVDDAVRRLVASGKVSFAGGMASTSGWIPTLSAAEGSLADRLCAILAASGAEPPSVDELSEQVGVDAEPILRFLDRRAKIVQVEQRRYYDAGHLKLLVEALKSGMSPGLEYGPSELRELLGFSRKFLIPFLEYCDRVGYTIRGAGGRMWRGA
jgi:selenocysteine-specific elongation factor